LIQNFFKKEIKMIRDIYTNEKLQYDAFKFAERYFSKDIFNLLCGQDENGNILLHQDIRSLLNQIEDFGEFTSEEWEMFFKNIRIHGI